jgi:hypothetical protein
MAKNFSTIEIAKIARRCSVTATPSTALVERCVAFNVAKLKALRIEDQTTFCHSGALVFFCHRVLSDQNTAKLAPARPWLRDVTTANAVAHGCS